MIIVEGPDGAGKSTLVQRLIDENPGLKLAPRACTSLGGPLRGDAMRKWLRDYSRMYGYIYDRHQCISGAVYDAIRADPPDASFRRQLSSIFRDIYENAHIVYCRPPRHEILKAVHTSDQMAGVTSKIDLIIDMYDSIMANMVPHEVYDWTKDDLPYL